MRIKAGALKLTGYRLPTEAEWEYAARAGALTILHYGASEKLLGRYAWYLATSKDRAWPVGSLQPNDLGLFDMLGNALEWCQDPFMNYKTDPHFIDDEEDIRDIESRQNRVLRGGAFTHLSAYVRSAYRDKFMPADSDYDVGFRPARTFR